MVTKVLYMIALGVLSVMFVGQVLNASYKIPTETPQYPLDYSQSTADQDLTADQKLLLEQYNAELTKYTERSDKFSKNFATILMLISLALILIGFLLVKFSELVGNGILLGGVVLLYDSNRGYGPYAISYNLRDMIIIVVALIMLLLYGLLKMDRKLKVE